MPAGDLHQRGLAGAVFAEQRDDLSRVHVEGDALQRMHSEEALLDVPKLQNRRAHDLRNEWWTRQRPRSSVSFVPEFVHVVLSQHPRRDEHLSARGNAGPVAREDLRHERHRLVAELERLLHHGTGDRARLHARQRLILFIKGDDRHLANLVRVPDGIENCRAVVAPQADEGSHIGMGHESLRDVCLGAHPICVVGADIENLDLRAGDRFLDAPQTLLRVARVDLTDEQHDLAALGQHRLDQFARLPSSRDVVGADVALALAGWRIAVVCEHQRPLGRIVEHGRLVGGINRADSDAVHALGEQVLHDPLLSRRRTIAKPELDCDVRSFGVGLFRPLSRDRPEVRRIVRDEGERMGGRRFPAATGHE